MNESVADRLLVVLRKDHALFVEVLVRMEQTPRCTEWRPTLGTKNSWSRVDMREPYGTVAYVEVAIDGSVHWTVRGDGRALADGTTFSVSESMRLADVVLHKEGWVFPPMTETG